MTDKAKYNAAVKRQRINYKANRRVRRERAASGLSLQFVVILVVCIIFFNLFGAFSFVVYRSSVNFDEHPSVDNQLTYTVDGKTYYTYIDDMASHYTFVYAIEDFFASVQPITSICQSLITSVFKLTSLGSHSTYDPVNNCSYVVMTYGLTGKFYHCLLKVDSHCRNCNYLPDSYDDAVPVSEVLQYDTNTDFGTPLCIWDRTDWLAWSELDGWCSFSAGNSEWVTMEFYGDYDLALAAYSASFVDRN